MPISFSYIGERHVFSADLTDEDISHEICSEHEECQNMRIADLSETQITRLPMFFFYELPLKRVILPPTIIDIDADCFYNTLVRALFLKKRPSGAKKFFIGSDAFANSALYSPRNNISLFYEGDSDIDDILLAYPLTEIRHYGKNASFDDFIHLDRDMTGDLIPKKQIRFTTGYCSSTDREIKRIALKMQVLTDFPEDVDMLAFYRELLSEAIRIHAKVKEEYFITCHDDYQFTVLRHFIERQIRKLEMYYAE